MGIFDWLGSKNKFEADPYSVRREDFMAPQAYYDNMLTAATRGAEGAAQRMAPTIAGMPTVAFDTGAQQRTSMAQDRLGGMLFDQAMGRGPSAAGEMARLQTDAARRQAASISASAASRGGASIGQALRAAQNASVNAAQGIAGQAGVQAIQERQGAMGLLGQALAQQRSQDIGAAQAQAGVGLQNNAQQIGVQSTNAQLGMQQQQMNDQLVQFYTRMGFDVVQAQAMARQAYEQLNSGNYNTAMGINAGIATGNAQNSTQLGAAGIGAVASGIAGAIPG